MHPHSAHCICTADQSFVHTGCITSGSWCKRLWSFVHIVHNRKGPKVGFQICFRVWSKKSTELASSQQISLLENRRAPVRPPMRALQLDNPLYTWFPQGSFIWLLSEVASRYKKNLLAISLSTLFRKQEHKNRAKAAQWQKKYIEAVPVDAPLGPFLTAHLSASNLKETNYAPHFLEIEQETHAKRGINCSIRLKHTLVVRFNFWQMPVTPSFLSLFGRGWQYRLNGPQHSTTEHRKVIGQF